MYKTPFCKSCHILYMCSCKHVCVCAWMCLYIGICMFVWVCVYTLYSHVLHDTHAQTHTYIHVHKKHIYRHTQSCVCMLTHTHPPTHAHTHIQTHTQTHTDTHTHTQTQTQIVGFAKFLWMICLYIIVITAIP